MLSTGSRLFDWVTLVRCSYHTIVVPVGPMLPSPAHVIFIPGVLLVGMVIGYVLGARAARAELSKKRARLKE